MSDTTTPAAVTPGLARLRASPDADAIRSKVIAQSKAALAAAATTKAASPKAKKTTAKKAAPKKAAPKKVSKPAAKPTGAKVKKPEPGARQPKFAYAWDEGAKIEILVATPPLRAGALVRFKMIKPGMRVATYAEKVGDRRLAMNDLPWFAAVKGFLRLVPGRG